MTPTVTSAGSRVGPLLVLPLIGAVLFLAYSWGRSASLLYVAAPVGVAAGIAILRQPRLGLLALIAVALALPLPINTGTEVRLNPAALFVPALFAIWEIGALLRGRMHVPPSPMHLPLLLFLLSGLLSLGIGLITWDPLIPRRDAFIIVQLAQWAIFVFSAMAFWLTPLLARDLRWLQRMTVVFLAVGGGLALLRTMPALRPLFLSLTTGAVDRAPFWLLLSALAGGQLLYNQRLGGLHRLALIVILLLVGYYAFTLEREGASTWVGVTVAGAVLFWLRFPRLRAPLVAIMVLLGVLEIALPALWGFAGGDEEWQLSGVSRLMLMERVVEVAMRNPITGLGPAAYRVYASWEPLTIGESQLWLGSVISSHNNYVDLFAHGGMLGLALFLWFAVEYGLLGNRLRRRYPRGFSGAYVASMLAAGAGALVIMLLADWMLPFVYNIGFHGFQASVLVWLFLGGAVALDNMPTRTEDNTS